MKRVKALSCWAESFGDLPVMSQPGLCVLASVFLALVPVRLVAQISVTKIGESLIGNNAQTQSATTPLNLRPHQDDAIVSFNGYQYCVYYSTIGANTAQRYVTIGRRTLPAGAWETIQFTDYTQTINDSHNVISLGICEGDGTIHLAFDHHNADLNYRISMQGLATNPQAHSWVAGKFNAVQDNLPGLNSSSTTGLTYPRFFPKPNGDLQFVRRKGSAISGKSMLYTYSRTTHQWTNHGVYLDGTLVPYFNDSGEWTNLNGYLHGVGYDDTGRLHASWVWRTTNGKNFDFMYAYSDNSGITWHNNAGQQAGTVSSNPMTYSNSPPVKVLGYPEGSLFNQTGQAVDSVGRVHVVQRKGTKFLHLYRDTTGTWVHNETTIASARNKITTDQNNNVYLITSSAKIYAATPGNNFTDWSLAYDGDASDFDGDAMFDESRMKTAGILSILAAKPGSSKEIYSIDLLVSPIVDPGQTSGMVAHWPLDEGSGTTTTNISGSSYTAELLNGASWGSDATRDSYVVFDGTDDRIETTFTYALADTNDFTWAWWAKKAPASHFGSIMVGNRYGNTGSENYEFIKFTPVSAQFANSDTTGAIERHEYANIPQNEWHHYAMVKSGSSYLWYVDGVAQGVASNFTYSETSPIPFLIGGDDDGSGTKVNEHFEGCIDDVVLYREALTPGEVADVKNGNYPYAPLVYELIAGWDTWDDATSPTASVLAPNATGSAVTTTEGLNWHTTDERGASNDGTWGTHVGPPAADTTVGTNDNQNLELPNATTGGTITFSITNTGATDIELNAFHFDAYAFRQKAARAYELSVVGGGGITAGTIYTSADDEITEVSGAWDNGAHDDIDLSLAGLADRILGAGESAQFLLAFSGGAGDGSGGHDLWVDNVGITGAFLPVTEPPLLENSMSGGDMVFSWSGGGFKVQSRTNLVEGIWIDLPGGDTPPVTNSTTDPEAFFRLIEQ